MRHTVVSLLLLVSFVCGTQALPRLAALGSLRDAIPGSAEMVDADELILPEPAEYKNPKPLIGILSQACHYCPGK